MWVVYWENKPGEGHITNPFPDFASARRFANKYRLLGKLAHVRLYEGEGKDYSK